MLNSRFPVRFCAQGFGAGRVAFGFCRVGLGFQVGGLDAVAIAVPIKGTPSRSISVSIPPKHLSFSITERQPASSKTPENEAFSR
ncbi:hypothetical protein LAL4801_03993 [Roseibium aggregatum]|uniref:Uncharacterized protein n=1 Tax=Roseibium aggregatum TaxID=187304 RepID=A0A0M6Y808_9HYPH|nr:hypothetical protein [Roseibium aggregatum]CTQ45539.1 hypothetical protein LAL4801_03993 [Roseibium aggregatum]